MAGTRMCELVSPASWMMNSARSVSKTSMPSRWRYSLSLVSSVAMDLTLTTSSEPWSLTIRPMISFASSASRAQWTWPPARVTDSSSSSRYSSRWRTTRSLRARPASLSSSQSGISSTATARLRRMVWVALPRLRLSCESERLSLADCSNVGVGPGENASEGFVATLYLPTLAGEYLDEVHGPDPGA